MIQRKRIFIKSKNRSPKKITFVVAGIIFFAIVFVFFSYDFPDLNNLEITIPNTNIILESYDGEIIATYNIKQSSSIGIKDVPLHTIHAITSAIDPLFYKHHGIDIKTNFSNILSKIVYGTNDTKRSTITQRVAKNLFSSRSESIKRRIQEYILSTKLEKKFTKNQILSMYLNRAYFGAGLYGVDEATQRFFGKNIEQLTLYESVKLAVILMRMNCKIHYNINLNEDIKNILSIMKDAKYITEDELNDAIFSQEKINNTVAQSLDPNKYFSDLVLDQVENLVIVRGQGDIFVKTTLDSKLQKKADLITKKIILENGLKNRATQIALISIDKIGAIRAMIGGTPPENTFLNRVTIPKPIGSLFDFFTYLAAIESSIDIYDSVKTTPLAINTHLYKISESFQSGEEISLINAFINSIDICSLRLAEKIGINPIKKKAESLGISNIQMKDITGSLGIDEASLMEIVAAYSIIMNCGNKINPFGIICIQNESGKELYRAHKQHTKEVISQSICEKMKILLRESMLNGISKQANISEIECYGKIGFSNDNRNASFVGFSNPLITGVWMGNDNNTPMTNDLSVKILPAIIWKEFMQDAFNIRKSKIKTEQNNNIANTKQRKRIRDLVKFTFS